MPMYEFECPKCHENFEELVRTSEAIKQVACPNCGQRNVKKKLSVFSAKVSGSSARTLSSATACAPGGT